MVEWLVKLSRFATTCNRCPYGEWLENALDCLCFLRFWSILELKSIGVDYSYEFCIVGIITNLPFSCDNSVLARATWQTHDLASLDGGLACMSTCNGWVKQIDIQLKSYQISVI